MSLLPDITPLVLTFNEAPNIRRTLEKLAWAGEILVVDSFSADETLEIIRAFPQARVVQRKFDSFAQQCNFGLEQIKSDWVLSLDADYVLTDELIAEFKSLAPGEDIIGYTARFKYCVHGRVLRSSLYPPRTVLYLRTRAQYHDEGHGHRVKIAGSVQKLRGFILHDDRKPLETWFSAQDRYARQEARHLLATPHAELKLADRIRLWLLPAPILVFLYTFFGKGLIFNGSAGWFYVFQRTLAELLLSLRLLEARLSQVSGDAKADS